jgi:uridine kinase
MGRLRIPSPKRRPVLVGVAGGSGSGKTRLVERLVAALPPDAVLSVSFDAYYRDRALDPPAERELGNFDRPEALDVGRFVAHLRDFRAGRRVDVPVYSFERHTVVGSRTTDPRPWIVLDGILLLAVPEIRALLDVALYLDVPESVRLRRRLRRDQRDRGRSPESIRRQWTESVLPAHRVLVEPSRTFADLVLGGVGEVNLADVWNQIIRFVGDGPFGG